MNQYSILKHTQRFSTNQDCVDYLVRVRWNNNPQCPSCGNDKLNYYLSSRKIYKCSGCYKQFSIIQGTIFERSKIPLTKWFLAIYFFTINKRGISSYQLAKLLDVKQQTAWFMMHRLREALKEENEIVLSGIVEADETFVGPKINRDTRLQREMKNHYDEQDRIHGLSDEKKKTLRGFPIRGGRAKGDTKEVLAQKKLEKESKGKRVPFERNTIVFNITEQNDGRMIMKKIGNSRASLTKSNVNPLLQKHTSNESVLITDQSKIYNDAKNMFVEHKTVNHDIGYVLNGIHINNAENIWNHLKRMIDGTYFHLSYHHFDRYLNEYTYRWNRRKETEQSLFDSFMPLVAGKRITYEKLIKREPDKLVA